MSKEMKMADYFDFSVSYIVLGVRDCSVIDDVDRNYTPCDAAEHAVRSHDRLVDEVAALREALRLKEAKCETLASDISRIVSAAADAHLSGSEQLHVDHLYRVIHDASGSLYGKGKGDEQ